MTRHMDVILLRTPEVTSAAHARSFDRENVGSFFNLLEKKQDAKQFPPTESVIERDNFGGQLNIQTSYNSL